MRDPVGESLSVMAARLEPGGRPAAPKVDAFAREGGLDRGLSQRQLTMIGIGGAIGTGLFMGSGMAIAAAGPGVLVSYVVAALIALVVMLSLSEMTVAHPTSGSFGAFAEAYLSPAAGFVTRYTYWAQMVILIGSEAVAIGHYMQFWAPGLPVWASACLFGGGVLWVNTRAVGNFGSVEYWLSTIKVTAILAFIAFGAARIFGLGAPAIGFANYTTGGGPLPFGWGGVWMGVLVGLFSFFGMEMIAVASGEAQDPQRAVPRAMRTLLLRLAIFYVLAIGVVVAIVPWSQPSASEITQSPFVRVFETYGFAAAAHVMNFVVLSAALSAMNSSLFMASRMAFSLARAGQAPAALGHVGSRGVPVSATLASSIGVVIAAAIALFSPRAFQYLMGISLFGGLVTWVTILVTHLRFRAVTPIGDLTFRAPLFPWLQIAGLAALLAVAITMAADKDIWRSSVEVGVTWLGVVVASYAAWLSLRRPLG